MGTYGGALEARQIKASEGTLVADVSGEVEKAGGNLTLTSFACKFVASALKVFPLFNASVQTYA